MKRHLALVPALVSSAAALVAASAFAEPFSSSADRVEFLPSGEFVHVFTDASAPGSITFPDDAVVRTLVVGGGGAGGYHSSGRHGGGGGAGGFLESDSTAFAAGTYTISVGAGAPGVNNGCGTNGGDSFIADANGVDIVRAKGGGGGGRMRGDTPTVGGSGGGGATASGANGIAGQGNKGGTGTGVNASGVTQTGGGGGGGGAGAAGGDSNVPLDNSGGTAGAGGLGKSSDITGVRTWYSGGGGGGVTSTDSVSANLPGMGGQGGGGQGGGYMKSIVKQSLLNGENGTGGGGGGGAGSDGFSGAGGSGIVVIRFSVLDVDVGPVSTNISLASAASGSLSFDGWFSPAGAEVYANVSDTAVDGVSRIPLGTLASGGNQRIEVSGLASEREYAISFELVDGQGRTSVSETVTASTTRSAEYPDAMVDASSISAGATHAVIPWRLLQCGGDSSISGATISYGTIEGLYPYAKTLSGIDAVGDYSSVLDGLQPSTTYHARLSIANSVGNTVERTFSFATAERIRVSATPSGHYASYLDGTDRVIVFTNTAAAGTLEVVHGGIADILVVGGGGAGGAFTSATALRRGGSGGGAGGFTYIVGAELAEGTYTVTVGAGGQSNTANSGHRADNGAPSSVSLGDTVVASALGGAGGQRVGGTYIDPGQIASGAGGTSGAGDPGTAGQGREGGAGNATRGKSDYADDGIIGGCGGGGGAGAPGGASSAPFNADDPAGSGGDGGDGLPCAITGAEAWYAGGGGGGVNGGFRHATPGAGGRGGGGTGASYNSTTPVEDMDAEPGTGGGGGGGTVSSTEFRGGRGGSGIVIFRFSDPDGSLPALSGFKAAASAGGVDLSFRIDSEGNGVGLDLRLEYGDSADSLDSSMPVDASAYEGDCSYSLKGFAAGETFYARLVATADDGETWQSGVFSFESLKSIAVFDATVLQRTVTLRGQCLVGDGRTMTITPAVLDGENGYVPVQSLSSPESITVTPEVGDDFSFEVSMPDFCATYDFALIVESESSDGLLHWTETFEVGTATTRDTAVYTWRDVDGDWDGSWTDPAHWSSDTADCRGYPDSPDCSANFAPCTSTNCTVRMPAGAITVYGLTTPRPANAGARTFTLRCDDADGCALSVLGTLAGWISQPLTFALDNVALSKTGDATIWCGDILEISGAHGGFAVTSVFSPYGNSRNPLIRFSIPAGGYAEAPVRVGSLSMTMTMRVEVLRDSPVFASRVGAAVYPLVSLGAPFPESYFNLADQPFANYTEMVVEYGKDDMVSLISARIKPLLGTLIMLR